MFSLDPAPKIACVAIAFIVSATQETAWGGSTSSSMSHASSPSSAHSPAARASSVSRATSGPRAPSAPSARSPTSGLSPEGRNNGGASAQFQSSAAGACQGIAATNCLARAEAEFKASGGDPLPLWRVPVPTNIPPVPPPPPIVEPATANPLGFEQSGGSTGVRITQGGGPTLADCMTYWDPAVHMTKELWKNVCVRTLNGTTQTEHALDPTAQGFAEATTPRAKHARHAAGKHRPARTADTDRRDAQR